MSTENEVNGAYPYYIDYYLHQNNVPIGQLGAFQLTYENGAYTITYWGYETITEPTLTDLEVYTLSNVMSFNQACQDYNQLSSAPVPMILTEAREVAVGALGGLPGGTLVWCSDDASIHVWDGTQWKSLAFQ